MKKMRLTFSFIGMVLGMVWGSYIDEQLVLNGFPIKGLAASLLAVCGWVLGPSGIALWKKLPIPMKTFLTMLVGAWIGFMGFLLYY